MKKQLAECESNINILDGAVRYIDKSVKSGVRLLHKKTYDRLETVFPEKHYLYSQKQLKWMFSGYEGNLFKQEQLNYKTRSGIMVRSKSERTIADLLTKHGIAFHYEEKILVNGMFYYPDFTIMREDGIIILWEHFGLMDNEDYFFKACNKIDNYRKAGYFTHTNLICTYEEDMRSEETIENIIRRYLQPILFRKGR